MVGPTGQEKVKDKEVHNGVDEESSPGHIAKRPLRLFRVFGALGVDESDKA
jgi:hypothetical protein